MINYYLGIDVSKGYADFSLLDETKETVVQSFQLDDTFAGHNLLYEFLSKFIQSHTDCELYCGLESTGGYENNWYDAIQRFRSTLKVNVSRLNPLGVNHNSQALMNRTVTDKVSSKTIAEYLVNYKKKVTYERTDYFTSLRRQWKFTKMLTKQKVQLLNQLEHILYNSNPEILIHCKHGIPQYIFHLINKYPTAKLLSEAKVEEIAKIPYFPKVLISEFIENAKTSVASMNDSITESIVRSLVEHILNLEKSITVQTKQMEINCSLPEVEILKSFKGIGTYSAVGLVLEIGAIERFGKIKKLASYFGIHPVYKESGDGKKGMHMSKKGRVEARYILYMVSWSAICHNPVIREIYKKHLKKGMCKMAAIGAIMHKILSIIYGMLKNKTNFDPEIHRRNSQKIIVKKAKKSTTRVRYLMNYDGKAPISRRQSKKRKEQLASQNE